MEAFREGLERHARDLAALGLSGRTLARPAPRLALLRALLLDGLALAIALSVALWGIAQHALPCLLTRLVVTIGRPDPDAVAIYKLAAGVVLFPLCWAVGAWTAWQLGGTFALVAFAATLGPTGCLALAWQARLKRARRDARAFRLPWSKAPFGPPRLNLHHTPPSAA